MKRARPPRLMPLPSSVASLPGETPLRPGKGWWWGAGSPRVPKRQRVSWESQPSLHFSLWHLDKWAKITILDRARKAEHKKNPSGPSSGCVPRWPSPLAGLGSGCGASALPSLPSPAAARLAGVLGKSVPPRTLSPTKGPEQNANLWHPASEKEQHTPPLCANPVNHRQVCAGMFPSLQTFDLR